MGALRAVPTFAEYSYDDLKLVDSLTVELQMPPCRVLALEGTRAEQVLFLVEGRANVEQGDAVIGSIGPGACIGATEVLDQGRHAVSVVAATEVIVRVASGREFRSLCHALPRLARWISDGMDMHIEVLPRDVAAGVAHASGAPALVAMRLDALVHARE